LPGRRTTSRSRGKGPFKGENPFELRHGGRGVMARGGVGVRKKFPQGRTALALAIRRLDVSHEKRRS
jgi:hypothetical protein